MRYRNLDSPHVPASIGDVFKWAVRDRFMGRRREAPSRYIVPTARPDELLLRSKEPSLTWVGHASWIVRLDDITIYPDPVWSSRLSGVIPRNVAPGVALDAAPPPDVVLVTHNHRDHLDAATIDRLGEAPTYVVPEGLGDFFRRRGFPNVIELGWWRSHEVKKGARVVNVTFVPSQHWSRRGLFDQNDSLWGGYVVEGGGRSVYHAGDTAWFSGFEEIGKRHPKLDAALLPIGAYDPEWFMRKQHMNPEDALRAYQALGASLFCAMHWGTFKLTDEPLDEPPLLLEELRNEMRVPKEQVWVPAIGESRRL